MKKLLAVLFAVFLYSLSAFAAVNLNSATKEELESLKGVGPAKAQAIIDYRQKNGAFKTVDDLNNVPGFGDKTLEKLRGEISVSGRTTVTVPATPAKAAPAAKTEKATVTDKPQKEPKIKETKAKETKPADTAAAAVKPEDTAKADKKAAADEKKAAKKAAAEEKKAAKEAKRPRKQLHQQQPSNHSRLGNKKALLSSRAFLLHFEQKWYSISLY